MSKSKTSIIAFVVLSLPTGFFLGALLSRFFIPKGVGLAGGAMVLAYGVSGAILALLISMVAQKYLSGKTIKIITLLLGMLSIGLIAWIAYKMNN